MHTQSNIIRLLRNISITVVSVGWLVPIWAGFHKFLLWVYRAHQPDYHKEIDSGFHVQMSNGLITVGLLWLGIILAFWFFVAANKLWPGKKAKSQSSYDTTK